MTIGTLLLTPCKILLQPVELCLAEFAHAFELHYVDQADEMNAFVVEAVPAVPFCAFAVALEVQLSVVDGRVVLAGHVEDLPAGGENLIERVELRRFGGMREVAGVYQEVWGVGGSINLAQCGLKGCAVTSVFAALLKPMWLSLIWTNEKSDCADVRADSPKAREVGTPPLKVQTRPVPAQAMHLRNPRRSMPSALMVWFSAVSL